MIGFMADKNDENKEMRVVGGEKKSLGNRFRAGRVERIVYQR